MQLINVSAIQGMIAWYLKANKGSTELNRCLLILQQFIMYYNSDGIEKLLKNPTKIKNLQSHYCNQLQKYLKTLHSPQVANILFAKAIMLIHETQRAHDLSKQRLKLM